MLSAFDWHSLVSDCGDESHAFHVIDAFRAEAPKLTDAVRHALRDNSRGELAASAQRLQGALNAINASVAAELAARLPELMATADVSPYPVWMKLCAELGRIDAAMSGLSGAEGDLPDGDAFT